jgi:hypothetical protein
MVKNSDVLWHARPALQASMAWPVINATLWLDALFEQNHPTNQNIT